MMHGRTSRHFPDRARNTRRCGKWLEADHAVFASSRGRSFTPRGSHIRSLERNPESRSIGRKIRAGRYECRLYRLRGVFLAAMGADETQIEASFCAAISTAKKQKSISLAARAEASYAAYRCRRKKF